MKKIKITVARYENELWFEFEGVKFDTLDAQWEFGQDEIQIVREGSKIASARVSEARGEPIFTYFGSDQGSRQSKSAFLAEDFVANDAILFEVPDELNLVNELRRSCWLMDGFIATVPIGESISLDEARDLVAPELARTQLAMAQANVLCFRRGK